jgi:uncharacterized delta-60 repeat protein
MTSFLRRSLPGRRFFTVVHQMAPAADLTLICIDDEIGLAEAEQYAAANGITIINHSVSWYGDASRGDGTGGPGTPDAIVAQAKADGILWVNAAGNFAQRHWTGTFTDTNQDGWEDFTPDDEGNSFFVPNGGNVCVTLRWDSWPTSSQDYDLYVFEENGDVAASSTNMQNGTQAPVETACFINTGGDQWFFAAINRFAATTTRRFDMFAVGDVGSLQYHMAAQSLLDPATSPAALAVGAVCWSNNALEPYSSIGPTIDNRIKPDIVGPDSVSSPVFGAFSGCGGSGFTGTSAATPHVAGAAALVEGLHPGWTIAQVRAYLIGSARDLGVKGADDLYGAGVLQLLIAGPSVTAMSPTSGPVGTAVTITGKNLADPTGVDFGGISAAVASASATSIKAIVPAGASTGNVTVATSDGQSESPSLFKLTPSITGFAPANALPDQTVTVTGFNLTGATSVKFGTLAASSFAVVDDTTITVTVPAKAVSGKITVVTPSGSVTSASALGVAAAATIASFSPASGPVGTVVTVSGNHVDTVTSATIGSADVGTITHESATQLKFTVPLGVSTGRLALTNAAGTATSATAFKVTPKVVGFAPTSAVRGATITITGSNLAGATSVKFGTVAASFAVVDDQHITATVPNTAVTATVAVTTMAGTGTSTQPFTVTLSPTLASFSPAFGPVGTVVTVYGTHVDTATSATLGGADVGSLTHVGATQVKFTVPLGASTGQLALTNAAGTATSATVFKVTPKIVSFAPTSAVRGATITITGWNFTGATTVKFGTVAASFAVGDDQHLTATVPNTAITANLAVTTSAGTGTSTQPFTVIAAPTIASFSPGSGPVGTVVTVAGNHLDTVTSATLGGADVGTITHVSATQLKFSVPPAASTGTIVVTNDAGSAVSLGTFTVKLAISGFYPTSGPRHSIVTLSGSGFMTAGGVSLVTGVKFGDAAANFTVQSASEIVAYVPWEAQASGPITVANGSLAVRSAASFTVKYPPANDLFDQAVQIGSLPFTGSADASYSTWETGEPTGCTTSAQTMWWSWTAPTSGAVAAETNGPTVLDVFQQTGSGLGGLSLVTCSTSTIAPTAALRVTAGTTYYFRTSSNGNGSVTLHIDTTEAEGSPDASFGANGVATVLLTPSSQTDFGSAVAVQPNGKVVVAGHIGPNGRGGQVGVARLNADGTLDTAFGTNGVVKLSLGFNGTVASVLIASDGSIFVVGGDNGQFQIARLTPSGALDSSFGTDGVVSSTFGSCQAQPGAAYVQPDGKVVVAGVRTCGGILVARYDGDGSLDPTFGSNGVGLATPLGASGSIWTVDSMAIDASGRVLVEGLAVGVSTYHYVARLTAAGVLDDTFGNHGIAYPDIPTVNTMSVDANGKILLAGFVLARLNDNGSLDPTFINRGGWAYLTQPVVPGGTGGAPYAFGKAIGVDSDGRIVIVGNYELRAPTGGTISYGFVERYLADGSPDLTMGPGGILVTQGCSWLGGVTEPDGTTIAVGFPQGLPGVSTASVFVVGRYLLGPL